MPFTGVAICYKMTDLRGTVSAHRLGDAWLRYHVKVTQPERQAAAQSLVADLNDDDQAWLERQLVEYKELLEYLREH